MQGGWVVTNKLKTNLFKTLFLSLFLFKNDSLDNELVCVIHMFPWENQI